MEVVIKDRGKEVTVCNDHGEVLLKIPFEEWKETPESDTICQDCSFYQYCSFSIFGLKEDDIIDTENSFEGLICNKIMNRVPSLEKMNIDNPEAFYNLLRGKVIKKKLRR